MAFGNPTIPKTITSDVMRTTYAAQFLFVPIVILFASIGVAARKHAPLPEKLVSAQKLYLVNDSGDVKVYDKLYGELKKWGRFTIVTSRADADIIAVLSDRSEGAVTVGTGTAVGSGNVVTGTGTYVTVPNEYMYIRIFEVSTGDTLWSDRTSKRLSSGSTASKLLSNLKKRMAKPNSDDK
jgi:hypothetical protein